MTIEEIKVADFEALEARAAEIESEDRSGMEVEVVEERATESEAIEARKNELREIEARKAEEREAIAADETLEVIKTFKEETNNMKTFEEIRSSAEYLKAYADMVKSGDTKEIRSLASELASGTIPVPTSIAPVVENTWSKLGLADRATSFNIKGILKVPYEVSATAAAVHEEGTNAPAEEELVFGTTTLTPITLKKWITITDDALAMSDYDFLAYVVAEIGYQIMLTLDNTVVAKIKASSLTDTTIDSAAFDAFSIFKGLSKLADNAVNPIAIMTKDMYFNTVMAIVDDNGRPIYNIVSENGKPSYSVNGVEVVFNASAANDIIVGDMSGFGINYQESKNINLITDPYSLAEKDLIKVVGNIKVGLDVIKPKHFAVIPVAQG